MFPRRELLNQVEARGVRLTAQRRALIETIQEATTHLDAASLLKLARERDPKINRATVYRTIELLKKLGMIDELDLMHLERREALLRGQDPGRPSASCLL